MKSRPTDLRQSPSGVGLLLAASGLLLCACTAGPFRAPTPVVFASAETEPVASRGDAADDPAIWVNRDDPRASLILGTDKKRGLNVYRLDGTLRQSLPVGRMNNVDLREDFQLGGRHVVIVAASDRDRNAIALFAFTPEQPDLVDVADAEIATGLNRIYGLCMYRSQTSGQFYVFVNDKDGRYQQHELVASPSSDRVSTRMVREFLVAGQPEGCAADDQLGWLYVGEEAAGFYRLSAAADASADRVLVDRVGAGRLVADVEGIALYRRPEGHGYLVVSSQGDDSYALYQRAPPNEFVGRFRIGDGPVDGTSNTDGLEVTSEPLPPPYEHGLLVVQDGANTAPRAPQNFKMVPWREVPRALRLGD